MKRRVRRPSPPAVSRFTYHWRVRRYRTAADQELTPGWIDEFPVVSEHRFNAKSSSSAQRTATEWFHRQLADPLFARFGSGEWQTKFFGWGAIFLKAVEDGILLLETDPPPPTDPRWPPLIAMLRIDPAAVKRDMPVKTAVAIAADYLHYTDLRSGGQTTDEQRYLADVLYDWPTAPAALAEALNVTQARLRTWLGQTVDLRCPNGHTDSLDTFSKPYVRRDRVKGGYDTAGWYACRVCGEQMIESAKKYPSDGKLKLDHLPCPRGPIHTHVLSVYRDIDDHHQRFVSCAACKLQGAGIAAADPDTTTPGEKSQAWAAWDQFITDDMPDYWKELVADRFWEAPASESGEGRS